MRRFLIVGNQSLGSRELRAAVDERVAEGPCHFHIVVPATPPHDHRSGPRVRRTQWPADASRMRSMHYAWMTRP